MHLCPVQPSRSIVVADIGSRGYAGAGLGKVVSYGRCPYTVSVSVKTSRVEIRLPADEKELEAAAAMAVGESLSAFVRRAARTEAERVLAERSRIELEDDRARAFLAALERPAERDDRLARLRSKPSLLDG